MLWNEIEGSKLLRVPYPTCLANYSGVIAGDDDSSAQRVRRIASLKFVVLTFGPFFETV